MTLAIRPATSADAALIHRFVLALADYEKLLDEAVISEGDVAESFFGPSPRVFCDIAEHDGAAVGFAVWFYNYSTFRGRHGIYLEDLFVDPAARGLGAGKALLAHLARRCMDEGLPRLDWSVLDWNAPSIAFYDAIGADTLSDWLSRRLQGQALENLSKTAL